MEKWEKELKKEIKSINDWQNKRIKERSTIIPCSVQDFLRIEEDRYSQIAEAYKNAIDKSVLYFGVKIF